ncbi:MAG: DUF1566 domain-containing protein [Tolumonas sp.]|nr:DUF1566 domain-containing protein [Tolumonas sp.]
MMVIKNGKVLGLLLLWIGAVQAQFCQPESIPASTPDSQLIDNGDGTINDIKTGLMWKQCSEGQSGSDCATGSGEGFTWINALQRAQAINNNGGFASHSDWRVPNIKELSSLVEHQCSFPAINQASFPNTYPSLYWSSSALTRGNGSPWVVEFSSGYNGSFSQNDGGNVGFLRLVRTVSSGPGEELIDDGAKGQPSEVDTTPAGTPIQPVSSEPLPAQGSTAVSGSVGTDSLPVNPEIGNFE